MATNNLASGLLTLGQGLTQLGAVPEYQKRLQQMEQEAALKEQQFALNSANLKMAKEQMANARLTNLGRDYTELDDGTPEWFTTKEGEINQLASDLGTKPENIKLRIKSAKTQFEESKKLSMGHIDTLAPLIDQLNPQLTPQIQGFKTQIAEAKNPDELAAVTKGNEKLIENMINVGIKLQDRSKEKELKGDKEAEKKLERIRGQLEYFENKVIAKEKEQLASVGSVNGLLQQGNQSMAASELSKTLFIRLAGDPRPSDADLARVNPNPSWISAAKRLYSQRIGNKPYSADLAELKMLAEGLTKSTEDEIRKKTGQFVQSRKGLITGIGSDELEDRLLQSQGLVRLGTTPQTNGQTSTSAEDQQAQAKKQGVYDAAQTIIADPNASAQDKNKAQAALNKLSQQGFTPAVKQ